MADVVTISGSPSRVSRSTTVLEYARTYLEGYGFTTHSIVVRDLNPEDLLYGRFDSPAIQDCAAAIHAAAGVVIATPVYKAAYTGVLKVFLDLLPQDALAGKVILPCANGAAPSHMLMLDYALKPVLAALGAEHILSGVYLTDKYIVKNEDQVYQLIEKAEEDLYAALSDLAQQLKIREHATS